MATIITGFLTILNLIKVYHWQTTNYAAHIATGDLYAKLDLLIDQFIEVYQGTRPRITLSDKSSLTLLSMKEEKSIVIILEKFATWLSTDLKTIVIQSGKEFTSDLQNINDEMIAEVNRTLFLLSLK